MDAPSPGAGTAPDTSTAHDGILTPASPTSRYVARTLLWLALLAAGVLTTRDLPTFRLIYSDQVAHALTEGYAAMLTVGIVYCLWVQYCAIAERRYLLATIGLSGCGFAQLVHGLLSSELTAAYPLVGRVVYDFVFGWQIACAGLLTAAALDNKVDDLEEVRHMGRRTVVSSNILAVCIAVCLPLLARCDVSVRSRLPHQLAAARDYIAGFVTNGTLQGLLLLAAGLTVLYTIARSHARKEDRLTGSLTKFLLLVVASQVALLASGGSQNLMWWAAHALRILGLLVLLVSLAKEFGASYSDAHARIAHLEAVHYMSSSLSNTLDLRVVLLAMASDTARMLSATYASVMLADEEGETLTTYVTHGLPDLPLNPRQPQKVEGSGRPAFYSGHSARSFREKRIAVVDDVFTDVDFIPWKVLAFSDGYAVSVPLVYQDVALGVLNLFFGAHVPLNDEKIRLFQTVASAAAVAIANAQLYERSLAGEVTKVEPTRRVGKAA